MRSDGAMRRLRGSAPTAEPRELGNEGRARFMSVLAQATPAELATALDGLAGLPTYRVRERPETTFIAVRCHADPFSADLDLGELPVTRCSVELADGRIGHACVGSRNHAHAEMAAWLDALLQDPVMRPELERRLIEPLAASQAARRRRRSAAAFDLPSRVLADGPGGVLPRSGSLVGSADAGPGPIPHRTPLAPRR
jgi:alpha-D-ribose 1-methylphosphonate 5-triphosphate synthase subunit PhnG